MKKNFFYLLIIIFITINSSICDEIVYNNEYAELKPFPHSIAAEQPGWSLPACIEMWQDFNWQCDPDTTIPFASQQEIAAYIEGLSGNIPGKIKSAIDYYTDHTGHIIVKPNNEGGLNECHEYFASNLKNNDPAIIPFYGGERTNRRKLQD